MDAGGHRVDEHQFRELMYGLAGFAFENDLIDTAGLLLHGFTPHAVYISRGTLELWDDETKPEERKLWGCEEALNICRYRKFRGQAPTNIFHGPLPPPIGREPEAGEAA
jgi:hypothetical protein